MVEFRVGDTVKTQGGSIYTINELNHKYLTQLTSEYGTTIRGEYRKSVFKLVKAEKITNWRQEIGRV